MLTVCKCVGKEIKGKMYTYSKCITDILYELLTYFLFAFLFLPKCIGTFLICNVLCAIQESFIIIIIMKIILWKIVSMEWEICFVLNVSFLRCQLYLEKSRKWV